MKEEKSAAEQRDTSRHGLARNVAKIAGLFMLALLLEVAVVALLYFTVAS